MSLPFNNAAVHNLQHFRQPPTPPHIRVNASPWKTALREVKFWGIHHFYLGTSISRPFWGLGLPKSPDEFPKLVLEVFIVGRECLFSSMKLPSWYQIPLGILCLFMEFLLYIGSFSLYWKFLTCIGSSFQFQGTPIPWGLLIIWELPPFGSFHFMV